jgi:hypothetical protein
MGSHGLRLAAVPLAALLLAGCGVAFNGEPAGKQVSKQKVAVEFTLCKEDEGVCDTWSSGGGDERLLIGFRVPKGTKPPQGLSSKSGLSVQLTRSADYKQELNQKAPKGKKYKWFGYISDVLDLTAEDEAGFKVRMKLPKDFRHRRFKVRPVAGFTASDTTEVDCGDDVFNPEAGGTPTAWCIYAPPPENIGDNLKIKLSKH